MGYGSCIAGYKFLVYGIGVSVFPPIFHILFTIPNQAPEPLRGRDFQQCIGFDCGLSSMMRIGSVVMVALPQYDILVTRACCIGEIIHSVFYYMNPLSKINP